MVAEDLLAPGGGLVEDQLDLLVDDGRGLLAVALGLAEIPADEDAVLGGIEADGTEPVAHTVDGDHVARHVRGLLDVSGGSGGDVVQEDFLGHAPAQGHDDILEHLAPRAIALVVLLAHQREPAGLAAGNDGDVLHRIHMLKPVRRDGVARLVVSRELPFPGRNDPALFLRSHGDLQDGVVDVLLADEPAPAAHGQERRLVEQVLQVRAGESGRALGDLGQVDVVAQALAPGMYLEDLLPALDIRKAYVHPAVKAAGAQQRVVQNVGPVGGRHDDDAFVVVEAVHLNKQLVERLLALVVSAAQTGAALAAHRVDLVDEHDSRSDLLGLLEQVAYAARADTHVQLHEIGAGDGQELHAGFAGDSLGQQCFAGARRADQQHALGDARAHVGVRFGILEVLHDLLELLFLLVGSRHVGEGLLVALLTAQPRARLGEFHHAAGAAALGRAHHGVPQHAHHQEDDDIGDEGHPPGDLLRGRIIVFGQRPRFLLGADGLVQIGIENAERADPVGVCLASLILLLQFHHQVAVGVYGELLDLVGLKKLDHLGVFERPGIGSAAHRPYGGDQQHCDQCVKGDLPRSVSVGSNVQSFTFFRCAASAAES